MELRSVTTIELIRELKSRGFVTDLLVGIQDVERNIEEFNNENDEEPELVLSREEMEGVLKTLSNDIDNCTINLDGLIYATICDIHQEKKSQTH